VSAEPYSAEELDTLRSVIRRREVLPFESGVAITRLLATIEARDEALRRELNEAEWRYDHKAFKRIYAALGSPESEWTNYHEYRKRTDPPPYELGEEEPPPEGEA
jgi:hypothetical protein